MSLDRWACLWQKMNEGRKRRITCFLPAFHHRDKAFYLDELKWDVKICHLASWSIISELWQRNQYSPVRRLSKYHPTVVIQLYLEGRETDIWENRGFRRFQLGFEGSLYYFGHCLGGRTWLVAGEGKEACLIRYTLMFWILEHIQYFAKLSHEKNNKISVQCNSPIQLPKERAIHGEINKGAGFTATPRRSISSEVTCKTLYLQAVPLSSEGLFEELKVN